MLTNEQITNFQIIYKKHFGKEITRKEAYTDGIKLIQLMKLIYKPMTEVQYQQLQKKSN